MPPIAFTDTLPEATRLAGALRQRARQEYERGEWVEALGDLQAAAQNDPLGETPEVRQMHDILDQKLNTYRAKP